MRIKHQLCVVIKCLLVNSSGWDRLREERRHYERHQYAQSTITVRSMQVKAYLKFCEIFEDEISPYPCDSEQICFYVTFLARRLCYSSITNYLSGLNNHLKDLGCPAIEYADHGIKKCMAGIRRLKGQAVKQAAPLLPNELLRIFYVMQPTRGHTAVRAAMLLSFRALLRKAHVTNSDSALKRQDLEFHQWGIMVCVRKSKTNQFRERIHRIPVAKVANRELCAVFWVQKHMEQCPAPLEAQVFRVPKAGHSIPLPYNYYNEVIKAMCHRTGLPASEFSTHSLRRGGATFLRLCGASIDEIKERGDWRSECVRQYLKASVVERLTFDMRVAVLLDTF